LDLSLGPRAAARGLRHPARRPLARRAPPVEDAVIPRYGAPCEDLRRLVALCGQVPEWRKKKGRDYPLPCLLAIMVMATLAGVVCG
jgi:hypothetical protein